MLIDALTPLVAYTVFGIILRVAGIVQADLAPVLFRFVFVATLPPLIFTSIVKAPLGPDAALLPLTGFIVNCGAGLAAWLYGRWRGLSPKETGLLVLSAGIINMLFVYPFVQAIVGDHGLSDAALFDIGNATFVATIASGLAVAYGRGGEVRIGQAAAGLLRIPIFYALVAALVINLSGVTLPPLVIDVTGPIGKASMPVTLVALGISLTWQSLTRGIPFVAISLRMLLGFVLGLCLVTLFGIDGMTRWIVLASAAAPIGFGTVTLAAVGRLDVEKAAAAVSISVLIGMVVTTGLLAWGVRVTGG